MFHILHPLSHHIHFRARTQPRASHERAGTWMIPFLGISNHRNPLVRQPPIQKSNLKLCKSQNMSKHIGIISEPYFFTWKIMKVRIVTTQNLSATICHPGFFFHRPFLARSFLRQDTLQFSLISTREVFTLAFFKSLAMGGIRSGNLQRPHFR